MNISRIAVFSAAIAAVAGLAPHTLRADFQYLSKTFPALGIVPE